MWDLQLISRTCFNSLSQSNLNDDSHKVNNNETSSSEFAAVRCQQLTVAAQSSSSVFLSTANGVLIDLDYLNSLNLR